MTPPKPTPGKLSYKFTILASKLNTRVYRLTKGRVGGRMGKAPVCILHHRGAKSGIERESPLLYLEDGDAIVLVASIGGSPKHPSWYHNLRAHPDAEIERRGDTVAVTARTASAEERERLWPRLVEMYPDYDVYQGRSDGRVIPVVLCEPRAA